MTGHDRRRGGMKVLVLGSGAKDHAIAWWFSRSKLIEALYVAPSNPGTTGFAVNLPDVDPSTVYQFHHPPIHHFISALFMKFVSVFTNNTDVIEESMQWVPFACSVVILIASLKIMKRFMIDEKALCFGMALLCFHPSLILLSGSVNNDCMALMFSVLSILMTMVWISKRDLASIIWVAVFLGLGIST